ncbi:hypothetical protein K458DRAFT_383941 [Lentithecium fluviatile CBS 122367]|uniref:Uncharacterized protein n=1 Tax=Lentithecium fluviatile CBS 122367 TaxID=1168545 RepID=A0A6G1JFD9_9PLEO|nr:hypothetical protein K458DRAFT_383941 [Lentithecium fluviatile CBS 122367]
MFAKIFAIVLAVSGLVAAAPAPAFGFVAGVSSQQDLKNKEVSKIGANRERRHSWHLTAECAGPTCTINAGNGQPYCSDP